MTSTSTSVAEPVTHDDTITLTVQLAIRATPEQVWGALTDGSITVSRPSSRRARRWPVLQPESQVDPEAGIR